MSLRFLVLVVAFLLSGSSAYLLGKSNAKYEEERACRSSLTNFSAQQSVEKFFIATKSLEHIDSARLEAARSVLIQFAQLQVPAISSCTKAADCVAWLGSLTPSERQLSEVAAMKVPGPGR